MKRQNKTHRKRISIRREKVNETHRLTMGKLKELDLSDDVEILNVGFTEVTPSGIFSLGDPVPYTIPYIEVEYDAAETDEEYESRIKIEESQKKLTNEREFETYLRVKARLELETQIK